MKLLTPGQALALWSAVSGILLLAFLLRRRSARVVVPSLAPWLGRVRRRANPLWRELAALLLQLLAAALGCVALLRQPPAELPPPERPWVAVVDLSPSMAQAGRLEAAAEVVRAAGAGLVLAGPEPVWAADPGASARVEQALATLTARPGPADLEAAVALVQQAGGRPLVLSDQPGPDPAGGRWWVVGPGGVDLAVLSVRAQHGTGLPPERALSVVLASTDPQPRPARVRLLGPQGALGEEALTLPPGESLHTWRLPPGDPGWLGVELVDAQDGLPGNDRALTAVEPLRDARVALVGPPNRYLEQALALLPGVALDRARCGAWRAAPVDLLILDRCGQRPAEVATWWIDPPAGAGPFAPTQRVPAPVFTGWDRGHPLLRGVALRELNVAEASVLRAPPGASVLARAEQGPVFVASSAAPRQVALGFDLTRSDLPLTIAFPQLVYQLVLWARAAELAPPAPARPLGALWELAPGVVPTRMDQPEALGTLPAEGLRLAARAGAWEAGGQPMTTTWPAAELGSAAVGLPWPEQDRPAQGDAPRWPRETWLALAAALVLLVEFGVAPR